MIRAVYVASVPLMVQYEVVDKSVIIIRVEHASSGPDLTPLLSEWAMAEIARQLTE